MQDEWRKKYTVVIIMWEGGDSTSNHKRNKAVVTTFVLSKSVCSD